MKTLFPKDSSSRAAVSSGIPGRRRLAMKLLIGSAVCILFCVPFASVRGAEIRDQFDSFTRPVHEVKVATAEPGRVAKVAIQRGDQVKAGQVLLMLDSRVLEAGRKIAAAEAAATAGLEALKIEHELKRRRRIQLETLAIDGLGSPEELERATADEKIASASLRAAEDRQEQSRLRVSEIEAKIAARSVTAPRDGIVTDVLMQVGEYVPATAPQVATIVDLSQLRCTFFLTNDAAGALNVKQVVSIQLMNQSRPAAGVVEYVGVVTEAESGRVRVDVLIENAAGKHRSGVRCRLLIDSSPESLDEGSRMTRRRELRLPSAQSSSLSFSNSNQRFQSR